MPLMRVVQKIESGFRSRGTVLLFALLGALAAVAFVATRSVHACSCPSPTWVLELESVVSSDSQMDHASHWSESASLEAYTGTAYLRFNEIAPDKVAVMHGEKE